MRDVGGIRGCREGSPHSSVFIAPTSTQGLSSRRLGYVPGPSGALQRVGAEREGTIPTLLSFCRHRLRAEKEGVNGLYGLAWVQESNFLFYGREARLS